jgi:HEAT repeat protein
MFDGSYVADQSIGPLTELLRSPRDETRHHAAWLLGCIGSKKRPPAVDPIPALVSLLDDPSSRVRAEATSALRKFGTLAKEALPVLRKIMQRDHSFDAFMATMTVKLTRRKTWAA